MIFSNSGFRSKRIDFWKKHQVQLNLKRTDTSELRVVIAGCCRDNAIYLPRVIHRLRKLETLFKECAVLIIENDSVDDTAKVLDSCKDDFKDMTILHCSLLDEYPKRTHRLAYCRNKLVDEALTRYPDYDYLLMVDMDDVLAVSINIARFISPFSYDTDQWDIMAAGSAKPGCYYDLWALRLPVDFDFDCWERIVQTGVTDVTSYLKQFQTPVNDSYSPILVKSAFGGAAYYKLSKIAGCRYNGIGNYRGEGCEHVTFHRDLLQKNCRIFIDPKFKIDV